MKRADAAIVASVLAIGLVASVALGAIATVWGRTPAGNTALVVPFAGGPALVAGGWTALILGLDQRQEASRGRLVVGALLGGALALVAALVAVFASLPVEAIVALVLGLVLARELRGRPGPGALVAGVVVALVATGLTLLPTGLGFFLAPLVVPFVVVTPLLAAPGAVPRWSWLAPAALAHLVLVIVGLVFLGSRLVG